MDKKLSRRQFMTYLGVGTTALVGATTGIDRVAEAASKVPEKVEALHNWQGNIPFRPIEPTNQDDIILPRGFKYDVIAAWGDDIGNGEKFGYNCDLTVYFPIQNSSHHGLLWVNHEYIGTGSLFLYPSSMTDEEKFKIEQYNLGGSILEIKYEKGRWQLVKSSRYARRITANTMIDLTGPARGNHAVAGVTEVKGTYANCSGGATLWNTVLTCEENFEEDAERWGRNLTHYGWVVEVDPFNPKSKPKKHTSLGRFSHENAAMTLSKGKRLVVYMGDDSNDQYFYKYVSDDTYQARLGHQNSRLLEKGTLYVADLEQGVWLPLDINRSPKLKEKYKTQGEVLVHCREAAKLLGATPMDRPEDVEVNPVDGHAYLALTNNTKHGNFYGQILKILEKNNDAASETFSFEVFAVGGPQSGFACPDNLLFDRKGNLWVSCDISSSKLNKDNAYKTFKNNGVFFIPTRGKHKGEAFQFASGPRECEMTGPWFTPDEKTLFLAVQHPGEETTDPKNPTSRWPRRDIPRPAVVAIRGF
ncbi:PhoX family protein [Thermoflavimicrobium daqui]|uniref:DUF839 domain-containing protein n=1 Tax=Thermoflavimicrobium daqui TaxID=2137476 RepID=A0A364K607_9BACL|nr:PhoX family phosphatase [Thermoflavimicrobium daqui]RAL25745.1 hypothetical protein DL897_06625 [Thermoflavimicrobium daqui]